MNFIFVMLDSLRRDHIGCYGNPWIKTPYLDAFANESALFEQCYPESLPTVPVRRGIATGKRIFPFHGWEPRPGDNVMVPGWEPLAGTDILLSEILWSEGYRTSFFTDVYHLMKPGMNFHRGFLEWRFIRGQELDRYNTAPPLEDLEKHLTPNLKGTYAEEQLANYLSCNRGRQWEEDFSSPRLFREAMRWLECNYRNCGKFFMWVDCFDPHEPWDPPYHYRDLYAKGYQGKEIYVPEYGAPLDYISPEELEYVKALYAGEVTMVDKWFGRLVEQVKDLGLYDDTMIIVAADHGHPLGEHGIIRKMPTAMYPTLMDIPLLIHHPSGEGSGQRFDGYIYLHDIMPTILAQAGVDLELDLDGKDIWPMVKGDKSPTRPYVTSAYKDHVWTRDDDYAMFSWSDGHEPRLFDLKEDAGQFNNLADQNPELVKELYNRILKDAGGSLPQFDLPKKPAGGPMRISLPKRKK